MINIPIWLLVLLCILALPMVLAITLFGVVGVLLLFESAFVNEDEQDYRWK